MKHMKWIALLLALAVAFALTACRSTTEQPTGSPDPSPSASQEQPTGSPEPGPSAEPSESPSQPADGRDTVRLAVLSGPTGVGAAKLLSDADAGAAANRYEYVIAADNSELVAGLTSGDIDIAAVASNVAVNLYNKTGGGVKIIALGTKGVLHILEGGGTADVNSIADLAGETVYAAGQGANPEYILRYLLAENGLEPGVDVNIVFADAAEITARLLSGEIRYAMLPVPAATAAILKGEGKIRAAVDVTEAWDDLYNGSELVMTAVVARTQFIEEHPGAVAAFLEEYEASINYVNSHVDEAAELIAGYGITPSAAIARQAIPQCHLVFISGADMAPAVSDYFMVLYSVSPAAVGGALPDDAIYYVP